MGLLAMSKPKSTSTDNNNNSSGMGLLLVLFPQDNNKSTTTTIASKSLLSKAQSTISICALLLFITLLLFTLSTIPNTPSPPSRFLLHKPTHNPKHHFALQRMGTLYRKGTRAMTDLLVCHVADETSQEDFRFFLRLLHRSGLTASTDVVFIFSSPSSSSTFSPIVHQENEAFSSLLHLHLHSNSNSNSTFPLSRFFFKGTNTGETLWGNRNRSSNFTARASLSYGSVLSFDATELDPENSLAGFLDRVPLSLRRWACYPMLLGRVRRNFKHVVLVDARSMLILKDPLSRVRNRSPDSVMVFASKADKHGKKTQSTTQRMILPAVVIGGARGVRRLANAVVVEIVRAAIQHKKKKNSVSDSAVLSQLVNNEFMLSNKNVHLIASSESIPESSSLAGHNSGGGAATSFSDYAIIQRGTSNHNLNSVIKKQLCSSVVDSSVYRDC
ncbi:hypothetical protein SESBI_08042 [Sesbania bispinosa]|nr:hypothetical protein SESBI_08042 [Sesbania bispinosa]